jgi:hypothetical protein
MVGEIISEWRATSNRNGGRDHSGMVGDIERNQQPEVKASNVCGLIEWKSSALASIAWRLSQAWR